MAVQKLLAEETVSVSEFRKHPSDYFTDHPVAVISRNKPAGYVIGAELFESMMALIEQIQEARQVTSEFRPAAARLREIAAKSAALLKEAGEDDLDKFSE